ncbi:UDP-glucose/GDP-mannose dehydrogenase family protein [Anaerobacillus alkaliphilus]|uniref:UDP-glucose 6-dehydrogenase n=1 Tax=Anaerobacillus alkaliphilus TaxID=1548597 RepID=A0A4Q0VQ34_9BACI|nr:UDP-glucose/GDP-mannose dehydrogenase family protein [Anaerobacillus alkaliphilus]
MKISVVGTGYVGLVTGVTLSEIGHQVICLDVDTLKIKMLRNGQSPIYEPGLEDLLRKNINDGNIWFTSSSTQAFADSEVIFIAVGTPANHDGTANLFYLEQAVIEIAKNIKKRQIIVTKSTVPVGTNQYIKKLIEKYTTVEFDIVSNPEFLREGSAIYDMFHGDRIVIGSELDEAAAIIGQLYKPLKIPIYKTDIRSAEMIKYASNAFLATKISFINEIANLCDKVGANVEAVSYGMGLDQRIGNQFLQAGIGYGGSCFPKDTKALVQLAGNVKHEFELLKAVIDVNNKQQMLLVEKVKKRITSLLHKNIAVLGLSFKPNTDDMREAASLVIIEELVKQGATVIAYDPVAIDEAKKYLPTEVVYAKSIETAIIDADVVLILTEWEEIKSFNLHQYKALMKKAVIFDGRNCYSLPEAERAGVEYYSVGRPLVMKQTIDEASLSPIYSDKKDTTAS